MKIKCLVILLLLSLSFFSCKKTTTSNTAPATVYTIQGTAKYVDYVKENTTNPGILDSQMVYIKYLSDAADTFYIYAVQTDMNGYFIFYNLPDDTSKYIIYTKPTEKSNASFTASYFASDTTWTFPKDSIKLIATDINRENGIMVTTIDSMGDTIPGVTVTFYLSKEVALLDTFCTGAGSIATVTTNGSGVGAVTKLLPAGDTSAIIVYINAALRIDSGYTLKRVADTTTVGKYGKTGSAGPFNLVSVILK
jgi:hypothetical protein